MKRIKCNIHDRIHIRDISLTIHRNETVEIPDDILRHSKDLQKALALSHVVYDNKPILENVLRPFKDIEQSDGPGADVETRLNILEKSVSKLIATDNNIPAPKYEDYLLYSNTFISSDYDAMAMELFTDTSKRSKTNPGNAIIKNACLYSEDKVNFSTFYFDLDFESPLSRIFPMMRWSDDANVQMYITLDSTVIPIVSTPNINSLSIPIDGLRARKTKIMLALQATYNPAQIYSYSVLFKF